MAAYWANGRPARCISARASCSAAYHAAAPPTPHKKARANPPAHTNAPHFGEAALLPLLPAPRAPTAHNWKLATLETGNTCTLATFPSPLHAVALAPTHILHHPAAAQAFSAGKSHHPPQPRHPPHHHRQRARHQRMHQMQPQTRRSSNGHPPLQPTTSAFSSPLLLSHGKLYQS